MPRLLFYILLCCSFQFVANGQAKEGFQLLLTHENDVLAPANRDENYTGGLKLELLTPSFQWKWQPFFKFKNEFTAVQRFSFGGTAYTPQDLASKVVVTGDRPYASLMFVGVGRESYSQDQRNILSSELIIGGMGLPGPGNLQQDLHRIHFLGSTRPVPEGWPNQIGYNGSLVLNYNLKARNLWYHSHQMKARELASEMRGSRTQIPDSVSNATLIDNSHFIKKFELFQVYRLAAVDIGNYMMNAQAGVSIKLFNYNNAALLNYNPEIPTIVANAETPAPASVNFRCNVFVEPVLRFAAYNATLEGLLFNDKSKYKIPHSDINRLLFELNAGINVLLFDMIYLRYAFSVRTKEFAGGKPAHNWGGITLGYSPKGWHKVHL